MKRKPKAVHTANQKRLLSDVCSYKDQLKQWHDKPVATLEKDPKFQQFLELDYPDFLKAVRHAVSEGLGEHPDVAPYLESLRMFGNWDELRKSKLHRLEAGVKRPMSPADLKFSDYVTKRRETGVTDKAICDELKEQGELANNYSQQSFSKRCKKLNISRRDFILKRSLI